MARRRKKSSPVKRRRRSVGAMGKTGNVVATVAGIAGGAIAAKLLANYAGKMSSTLSPKVIAAAQVALGVFMPKIVKSKIGADLGYGMIAIGGVSLAQSFGVVSGIGAMEDEMEVTLSGTDLLSPINGYGEDYGYSDTMNGTGGSSDLDVISGMDDYSY
jgi:hypothetical protein